MTKNILKVGLAQIKPVWLKREETTSKIVEWIAKAGEEKCSLLVFGEALLPGYPHWVSLTDGARFNSAIQKEMYAHYCNEAVVIEAGHLDEICDAAKENSCAIYLGTIERAPDRGGHSLYCSLIYISEVGEIGSVHRKLMPTYEERLVWSHGDGHGLKVHRAGPFTVGGLNCWENWMPMARSALYGLGEDLHVAVWPGEKRNSEDITRFIAKESRSFVISVSGYLTRDDIPSTIPFAGMIKDASPDVLANGGSCIAGPDGEWVVEPFTDGERLITAQLDFNRVLMERQNFDPAGHYSRPDILHLTVDKRRQKTVSDREEK